MTYKTFDDWMNEIEGTSMRAERCTPSEFTWAKTAWDIQQEKIDKLKTILDQIFYEKTGYKFICGEGGSKDQFGLPDTLFVCPTYGAAGFAVYKKDREYSEPGY